MTKFSKDDDKLIAELDIDYTVKKEPKLSAKEQRIITGFEEIQKFIEKLKINPANVYFDSLGSLLKKFLRIGAFPKAKAAKTKIVWPTILVISPTGKLVESIEGSRPDFVEIVEKHL